MFMAQRTGTRVVLRLFCLRVWSVSAHCTVSQARTRLSSSSRCRRMSATSSAVSW